MAPTLQDTTAAVFLGPATCTTDADTHIRPRVTVRLSVVNLEEAVLPPHSSQQRVHTRLLTAGPAGSHAVPRCTTDVATYIKRRATARNNALPSEGHALPTLGSFPGPILAVVLHDLLMYIKDAGTPIRPLPIARTSVDNLEVAVWPSPSSLPRVPTQLKQGRHHSRLPVASTDRKLFGMAVDMCMKPKATAKSNVQLLEATVPPRRSLFLQNKSTRLSSPAHLDCFSHLQSIFNHHLDCFSHLQSSSSFRLGNGSESCWYKLD